MREKTIRPPVKTPPTNRFPSGNDRPKVTYTLSEHGLEEHEAGGDVRDRVRIYRQSTITLADYEDALTNALFMRSAINNGSFIVVDDRQHQPQMQPGAQVSPRERPRLPQITLYNIPSLNAREVCEGTSLPHG